MDENTNNSGREHENKQVKNEIVTRGKTKMASRVQPKFYAVAKGRQVGIFTTWTNCCKSVDGYSHNQYKGTETLEQAIEILDESGISHSKIQEIQDEMKEEGQYIVKMSDMEEKSDKVVRQMSDETEIKMSKAKVDEMSESGDEGKNCKYCEDDDDKYMMKCEKCKNWVHYMCTELPAYQISLLSNTSRRFTCKKCVNIDKDVKKIMEEMKDKTNLTKEEAMRILCFIKDENEALKQQNRENEEEINRKAEAIMKIKKRQRRRERSLREK